MKDSFDTSTFQLLKGKKLSHLPYYIALLVLEPLNPKKRSLEFFFKDDSGGNVGAEGGE
ncbi:hypothetical protein [Leptospira interrogans]|uniref:hypothetical protein n=1 Tax=Leptospira interrogans TaxID=173 RepID=UPI000ACFEAAE|nr:hypothetical protein [Leptospira interrogans]